MPRNRVIYQSEALYAGPTPIAQNHTGANAPQPLQRVQSANYSFNIERQDVNQFGELASIDRVILSAPTVALDFSYLVANLYNESKLGFHLSANNTWTSCISGILNKSSDEKNYFIRTVAEGSDVRGTALNAANQNVIGIGNGFITSYTTEASIGNFPTTTVNVEALNMKIDATATGAKVPSVDPINGTAVTAYHYDLPLWNANSSTFASDATTVLRPGQITLDLHKQGTNTDIDVLGSHISDAKIQSYNISFDLGRTPLEKLGSKFAFAREIDFPVTITMSVEANIGDLVTGNLADVITTDGEYDLTVTLKDKTNANDKAAYHIKKAKLDSQEFSAAIGDNKGVTLNFSAQVGGPGQNDIGFFMSGVV
mgnify:CR=1 FL=1|tara:strand:+ start:3129 stop:4235 length:1107 start_codon:yes stop_codon:yes gene_type:complete